MPIDLTHLTHYWRPLVLLEMAIAAVVLLSMLLTDPPNSVDVGLGLRLQRIEGEIRLIDRSYVMECSIRRLALKGEQGLVETPSGDYYKLERHGPKRGWIEEKLSSRDKIDWTSWPLKDVDTIVPPDVPSGFRVRHDAPAIVWFACIMATCGAIVLRWVHELIAFVVALIACVWFFWLCGEPDLGSVFNTVLILIGLVILERTRIPLKVLKIQRKIQRGRESLIK